VDNLFRLRDFHPLWCLFPKTSAKNYPSTTQSYNPDEHAHRFGLFRFRSPLLTESLLVFFSSAYLDVSVQRVCDFSCSLQLHRFPHSDIGGSRVVCTSPPLFAAYHVLRRLREPRHPPCALGSLPSLRLSVFTNTGSLLKSSCSCVRSFQSPSITLLYLLLSLSSQSCQ
jgi:hypothetical protein